MRILELYAEKVKRIKVIRITPKGRMVPISGKNGQGKTSVLDSIQWALEGKANIQAVPIHNGEDSAKILLTLGDDKGAQLLVERTFTDNDSYLHVTTPEGASYKSPQTILDQFIGELSMDPLKFMREKPADQLVTLRKLAPLEIDVDALDRQAAGLAQRRLELGRKAKESRAAAEAMVVPDDLPDAPPDVGEIRGRLATVDSHNSRVRSRKQGIEELERTAARAQIELEQDMERRLRDMQELARKLDEAKAEMEEEARAGKEALAHVQAALEDAKAEEIPALMDPAAILSELLAAEAIVRNCGRRDEKIRFDAEATSIDRQADALTEQINTLKQQKLDALAKAKMPIEGLGYGDGAVTYKGLPLSQASDAEQLRVSTAIAAALNPKLRVLRIRDGSLLDEDSLALLETFANERDFQIWIERVDSSGKGEIIMEDGHIRGQEIKSETAPATANGPTDEDTAKASAFLGVSLSALGYAKTVEDCDLENSKVKQKLKRFPAMIKSQWNPAYLARVKELRQ